MSSKLLPAMAGALTFCGSNQEENMNVTCHSLEITELAKALLMCSGNCNPLSKMPKNFYNIQVCQFEDRHICIP